MSGRWTAAHRQFRIRAGQQKIKIGQAEGIIMECFNVDGVQAFEMAQKTYPADHTPIRTLAER